MPVLTRNFPYFSRGCIQLRERPSFYINSELIEQTGKYILGIPEVKLNPKYRPRGWREKQKPRLKKADLDALCRFCESEGIEVFYHPETNTLWFEKEGETNIQMMHGWDTGGQMIRLVLSLMINSNGGRKAPPPELSLNPFTTEDRDRGKKGKACMLYIQVMLPTLRVRDTFTVKGGDDENPDAPSFTEYEEILWYISKYFGRNFTLEKVDDDGITITRLPNTEIDTEPMYINCSHNGHIANHLIMLWITLKMQGVELPPITIDSLILSGDYHIHAMINAGLWQGLNIRIHTSEKFLQVYMDFPREEDSD